MGADILILTIYFICVVYVLYQMALSVEAKLEDQVQIILEGDILQQAVTSQLEQSGRPDIQAQIISGKAPPYLELILFKNTDKKEAIGAVQIQVSPQGKQPLRPPVQNLGITVINGLPDQQVFLDWDSSSLSVHGGLAYRVIRNVPGMHLDLLQPQVYTVANPSQGVNARVTSEVLFRRPDNSTALEPLPMLVNLEKIPEMKEPLRTYSLRMLLWIKPMTANAPDSQAVRLLLPFTFRIEVLPDHVALPILSWLLDVLSPARLPRIW
ncbi:hypothetical protein [Leptolyngbya sp. PCC 6406]|uniref:hypothetical protein n=1 Tax=Leptolyngbya sp. PCC 6406 TaxID=1173264 RepID=UPI0002AC4CD6|nr:hypothetical protein [Leptolyngbya sp. PCC 6406]